VSNFNKIKINVSLAKIVLVILIVTSLALLIFYWKGTISEKWAPVIGGAAIASFTALFQYLISYLDYKNNERLSVSGVVNFLTSRDDKEYYANLISNSRKELNCLFFTSKRFCEDFCTPAGNDNLLITQLETQPTLRVRMLVQKKENLPADLHNNYDIANNLLLKMIDKFPERFQVKTYTHVPTHNIFTTEKDAIVGPYFHSKSGKYNHSIHFNSNADYMADYMAYFEKEWTDASNY
jgi:hypothetical protein